LTTVPVKPPRSELRTCDVRTNPGAITVDAVDLGDFDRPYLCRLACTAPFQDFARLELLGAFV
jgi:hypothetical protein